MQEEFSIYRPPTTSGRLEGTYYQPPEEVWRPSLSYKYRLHDIQNQFTPAEYFRHTLVTEGKYLRIIQKLEKRWLKNIDAFTSSAIRIQALHRGNVGRTYFRSVHAELTVKYRKREALHSALIYFEEQEYLKAIDSLDTINPMPMELLQLKLKSYYKLFEFKNCVAVANEIIELDPLNEESRYIQACAYIQLNEYQTAYHCLKQLMTTVEEPRSDAFRLIGQVSMLLRPRLIEPAIDSYNELIRRNNADYDAIFQRALCNICLQEWPAALKDLKFILIFKPDFTQALLMRARVYTCMREWNLAREDYNEVLSSKKYHFDSTHKATATKGLQDMLCEEIQLPMIDKEMLRND